MQWNWRSEMLAQYPFSFCLARSCTPKSESLPLRRWPCWPGPYSRRFTGDFGRPQIFSPIRRSILYLDDSRLLIAFPFIVLHRSVAKPVKETRPPLNSVSEVLTGLSRKRSERPRDMSKETPDI